MPNFENILAAIVYIIIVGIAMNLLFRSMPDPYENDEIMSLMNSKEG